MSDYSGERYDSTLPHIGNLQLAFDGQELIIVGGSRPYSYPAVSGVRQTNPAGGYQFDYSPTAQNSANTGPIPIGIYWINPAEVSPTGFLRPGGETSWGTHRITIHPFTTTVTWGRGGFFIHGGAVAGSKGCIDLTSRMAQFVADLRTEVGGTVGSFGGFTFSSCQIHLHVNYPHLLITTP